MSLKRRLDRLEGQVRFTSVEDLLDDLDGEERGETPPPRQLPLHPRLVCFFDQEATK